MTRVKEGEYTITIYRCYDGIKLFVTDAAGNQIYAHKVTGDAMERARAVIAKQ
jgi:CRISPR/Cas system CMR-associated protein Cmr3 (group 5 of RAMP superfamily)